MSSFDRNRRFSILAQATDPATPLLDLAERVLAESGAEVAVVTPPQVAVVTPPQVGMVMLRLREPTHGTVFNAGEILVTEARVTIGAHDGYAMRLGRAPELTLAAALLDAAVEGAHPLTPAIEVALGACEEAERARQLAAWREVAPTRVAFDEMR